MTATPVNEKQYVVLNLVDVKRVRVARLVPTINMKMAMNGRSTDNTSPIENRNTFHAM